MTYWQGPAGFGDGRTVETGDPRKNSRTVATAESPEMAAAIVDGLNALSDEVYGYTAEEVEVIARAWDTSTEMVMGIIQMLGSRKAAA